MRPTYARFSALAFALSAFVAAPAAARADVTVRTLDQDLVAGGVRTVGFHVPVGELQVVATEGGAIRAELALRCERESDERCREAAGKVDLRVRRSAERIQIEVDDWPKLTGRGLSARARLEVPKDRDVEVDMGVGEVAVEGLEGDVEVDVGVGEVAVEMAEAVVGSVNLDSGVGEVTLTVGGRTIDGTGFVGGALGWKDGPGEAHVEIDTGVGEIRVTLR